jgi:hypothetical protein
MSAVIGFAKLDKIVHQTVIHLSPEAFDFIQRRTVPDDLSKRWRATKVPFIIMASQNAHTEFYVKGSLDGAPRLYLHAGQCRGKRVVLEEILRPRYGAESFTEQHRADLEVALKELADAVRPLSLDLTRTCRRSNKFFAKKRVENVVRGKASDWICQNTRGRYCSQDGDSSVSRGV